LLKRPWRSIGIRRLGWVVSILFWRLIRWFNRDSPSCLAVISILSHFFYELLNGPAYPFTYSKVQLVDCTLNRNDRKYTFTTEFPRLLHNQFIFWLHSNITPRMTLGVIIKKAPSRGSSRATRSTRCNATCPAGLPVTGVSQTHS
jgi:hypothetical protein